MAAIEVEEDEEEDERIAESQPRAVEIAEAGRKSVGQRCCDAAEVDNFAENVCQDRVGAVDFEPVESATMTAHINPPVEKCH